MLDYPAPRYPRLKRLKSVEDLMPKARGLVNQPPGHHYHSLKPSYNIKSGDKVLFVALSEYHPWVVEAVCRAIREKGAKVDLLTLDSTPVAPPEDLQSHEAIAFGEEDGDYSYYYTFITNVVRTDTAKALVALEKYDSIIAGSAGPVPSVPFAWHRFNCPSLEDFAGPLVDTDPEVQKLINQKLFAQVKSCKTLRMVDPEGTDVQWTNYDDRRARSEGHILARPCNIGRGFGGNDDCTGVVSGTLGHMGAFPYCRAYIEDGQVARVEGGGKYGDIWREKLEKYKNAVLPPAPLDDEGIPRYQTNKPGIFWFFECAIGTLPGVFRVPREANFQNYANFLHDRMRSGYIHNGFGWSVRWQQEMVKAGLPWVHVHIHSMFATLEGRNEKGETVTIIDKGHLAVLDDPDVRAFAAKRGNSDEMLTEAWIPGVPGINVPGDYMTDYAQDPIPWIRREATEHPIWVD